MKGKPVRAVVTVLALWCAGLGAAAQFGKMSFAYALFQARFPDHGPVGIGLLVSVAGIVGLVFGTTAGLLVAQIGPRRAIVAALALGAAMSAGQVVDLPYAALFVTRVVEGFSHLAIVVVGPTMIAGLAPARHQGLAMTLWSSFFGVTYALLAVVAPGLLAGGDAGALFGLHAVWMAGLALVLAQLLPPDPAGVAHPMTGLLRQHGAIYASARIAAPATGFVCYTALYVAVLTLLPPLFPAPWQGPVAAAMPLVSIAVSLSFGVWLLGRMSAVRLVQAGFAVGAGAALVLGLAWGQVLVAVAAAMLLAGAMGIVQGASFAAIPQLNASALDRARASGAVAQLGNLGTTTGTPLLAALIAQGGPVGVAGFALVLCLAGIAIHAVQARRRAG